VPSADDSSNVPVAADPLARARRRGKTLVFGVFVTFATAFIVISTQQLTVGVFGSGWFGGSSGSAGPKVDDACVASIRRLMAAVDRAASVATKARDESEAEKMFRGALSPEWDDQEASRAQCAGSSRAEDAFAAALQVKGVEEGLARRSARERMATKRDLELILSR
jgi:hypothetical protein